MKKKLLFVIESLNCAGAEKSLATLLNLLDYERYDVDLQLFAFGGEFEAILPKEVNLLPRLPYFSFCMGTVVESLKRVRNTKTARMLASRLCYSVKLRTHRYKSIEKAVVMWKYVRKCFSKTESYDVAIAYAQGLPTFYVADCVTAKKKLAWINVTYNPSDKYFDFINKYYYVFNNIICVSHTVAEQLSTLFLEHDSILKIFYDINDAHFIERMAIMPSDVFSEMKTEKDWKLLTIGRFANQKGYDIATDACKILKERGVSFHWFVLGKGSMQQEIENWIVEKGIRDCFTLLGTRANPYPYFKACDIYVQTSKFEGFGLTIAEARMLNKPVVTTEFDAVYDQIVQEKNGLVVSINGIAVADGIQRMMEDHRLREDIVDYLKNEKKGNLEEIEKFYELLCE